MRIGLIGYMVSGAFLNVAYFDLMYLFVAFTAIFSRELIPAAAASSTGDEQAMQRERRLRSFDPQVPQRNDAGT
jgi:hypothetical protein